MKSKIKKNFDKGRYTSQLDLSCTAYVNSKNGWTDYFIAEQIIFSHRVGDYTLMKNFPEDLHAHDYYELIIYASGNGMQYITDGQYLLVRPGSVILTKPMAVHMFRAVEPTHYDRYVLYFKPSINILCSEVLLDFLKRGEKTYASFSFPEDNAVLTAARKIETVLNSGSVYGETAALISICEMFLALSDSSTDCQEVVQSSVPTFIREIKQYIDESFASIHSVSDLSEKFFYSREYITRVFRQYYNTPIYEYILKRKLFNTCSLLRDGVSVEKAASASGFINMSSFIKVFRKFMGCTPSEYKARKF